jgi:ubiquinone/menaquinone biosynthesis C-methylase UbiE
MDNQDMKEKPSHVNPFNTLSLAEEYETWYETQGRRADRLEKNLFKWLLMGFPNAHTLLEVGCGTGHFTRFFRSQDLRAIGLDISPAMLVEAKQQHGLSYILADAKYLPFASCTFDLVAFITTLEFLDDPVSALREASHVARQGIVIGAINRESWIGREYRYQGGLVWEAAHLYTLRELIEMVKLSQGKVSKFVWKTTLWKKWPWMLPLPHGGFIGLGIKFDPSNPEP